MHNLVLLQYQAEGLCLPFTPCLNVMHVSAAGVAGVGAPWYTYPCLIVSRKWMATIEQDGMHLFGCLVRIF